MTAERNADLAPQKLPFAHAGLAPQLHKTAPQSAPTTPNRAQVTAERKADLGPNKPPLAHAGLAPAAGLAEAAEQLRPSALVGVSTVKGAFSAGILKGMGEINVSVVFFGGGGGVREEWREPGGAPRRRRVSLFAVRSHRCVYYISHPPL